MRITVRILEPHEVALLDRVADGVFDNAIDAGYAAEFLADPRNLLAVALDDTREDEPIVVGMASALRYVHPDKPPELWINEVGVADAYHRRGLGRHLLKELMKRGRALGCGEAWVLTEVDNEAARGLYASVGGTEREVVMVTIPLGD